MQIQPFETTFDDIFNEAFNSIQVDPDDYVEIKVVLNSIKDDALNRFVQFCIERSIGFERKQLRQNLVLLRVNRSHFK